MDNFTSGSVIEPRTAPGLSEPTKQKNSKLVYIIIMVVEAIIIIGLAIWLLLFFYDQNQWAGVDDEGWLEEDELYEPSDNEALALMYIYSAVNDSRITNKNLPASFCDVLKNVYNSSANNDDLMNVAPCVNGRIAFSSASNIEEDLASVGEVYIGVLIDNSIYNYYISSDFSYVGRVEKTSNNHSNIITLSVGN